MTTMNNFGPLNPFSSLRKSLKRELPEPPKTAAPPPPPSTAPQLAQAKRSASAKRLPFSTIKSNGPEETQDVAELPPSPKLLEDSKGLAYLATSKPGHDAAAQHTFVRSHKTSSFHTYQRRNFRNEDNIGTFLEAFEEIGKRFNENKQNTIKLLESESSNGRLVDERFLDMTKEETRELSQTDRESLYCEIIYTIKHKIGRTIDGHNDFIADLYKYAQDAFGMSQSGHDRLFVQACEEKAPIIILNVEVVEARSLEAKDANGFSDPYCMLGIIPGNRAHSLMDSLSNLHMGDNSTENSHSSSPSSNIGNFNRTQTVSYLNPGRHSTKASESSSSHKTTSSLIKRFSSFRKSADKYAARDAAQQAQLQQQQQQQQQSGSNLQHLPTSANLDKESSRSTHRLFASHKIVKALKDGKLPAKFIKTTDVKKATLCPVWNERFRFQIEDIKHDTLHLDIWDHDDETSVFDAAKKLNEVKSLKGLDRYFKQIAQSARTSASGDPNSSVDDFLGSVNIPLDELASSGLDKWFELEGRENKKAEGKIRLRLKLATREDRGLSLTSEEDNFNDFKQHESILEMFVRYELERRSFVAAANDSAAAKISDWGGELSREAETILHQHAIQGDLTDFQIALCRWIAYNNVHLERELSNKVLFQKLEQLDQIWHTSSPTRDEFDELRESFDGFIRHSFKYIANIREAFPVSQDRKNLEKLEYLLKLLSKIFNMDAFKYCFPFQNSLMHELINILKNSTLDWFEKMSDIYFRKSDDDAVKKLIEFAQFVYLDVLVAFRYYKPIFEAELNVNYFAIAYKKIDSKLIDLIRKILTEEFGDDVKRYATEVVSAYSQPTTSHFSNSPQNMAPSPSSSSSGGQSSADPTRTRKDSNSPNVLAQSSMIFKYNTITEKISITLFELYTIVYSIYKFKNFLNENERSSLKIQSFQDLFYMPYKRWVDLLRRKIELKVEKCFDSEKTDVLTELTKFGSSSVEMCNCFTQVVAIWRLIDWPDFIGVQMFLIETVDSLTKATHKYASQVKDNCQVFIPALASSFNANNSNNLVNSNSPQPPSTPTAVHNTNSSNTSLLNASASSNSNRSLNNNASSRQTLLGAPTSSLDACQKLIIATNNLERVRESLKAYLLEIDLDRYMGQAEKAEKTKLFDANRAFFETQTNQASDYMIAIIEYLLESIIANKLIPELDPHMFYLFESPESARAQESVSRIIGYMDANLSFYRDFAFKSNFKRLLNLLWEKLLVEIENNVKKDEQRSSVFFAKISDSLDILAAFFGDDAQGGGLPKDYFQSVERFKQLKRYLKLQTLETTKLISLYYQDMIAVQNGLKSSEYGCLVCRAYFHAKDDTLVVEVVKCKNLIPMDQNGLSDPYVEIELKPRYAFQNCEKQFTSVIKKNLNPVFNEVFEFKIPEKSCFQGGNVIHFTVMDHDLVWSNDFEGEAFLELQSLPGVRNDLGDGGYKDLKYTELFLIRPKEYPSKIIEVLEYRSQDKIASDFLKMRKEKLKI